ncbi:tellurite resistance TerB family protein [Paracraurococcus ruber]|uniref:Tellurite resistance protein TerB n=1 Tax=Paracraurococcus ruber TaxID=77675 RepID=A0ABS1CW93_9PROT|nr:TerB family tellurite resistance protein [Paracraurococcus ruber]MBK1658674.1 Tellurite resistance protein TerB [Paracraurococcus ruber]TDG31254.1 TerB family tellurite resistance protein [Paracraurococcus ruber]
MFGMFKSQSASLDLTPRTCMVVSLIYCMGADGEMDEEEIGHLVSVLGRGATRAQLDAALRYVRATQPAQFLADSNARLRPEQKLCIILNMIDSAMSDGEAEQGEQQLVMQFSQAWGVPQTDLEGHFRTLVAKNDRSVLDR